MGGINRARVIRHAMHSYTKGVLYRTVRGYDYLNDCGTVKSGIPQTLITNIRKAILFNGSDCETVNRCL